MPEEEYVWLEREAILTFEETARLAERVNSTSCCLPDLEMERTRKQRSFKSM